MDFGQRRVWIGGEPVMAHLVEEASQGELPGGPVYPHIGHVAHPGDQMRLDGTDRAKGMPCNGKMFNLAHLALVRVLRAGAVGGAGHRADAPVMRKGKQAEL